jgi:hypothetical protein
MSGSDTQKTVFFDTNIRNENGSYSLHRIVVKANNINPGEVVTAIQEGEEWDAVVVLDDNVWGLEIISEAREISDERRRGHTEGSCHGGYAKQIRLVNVLARLKLDERITREILEGMGITV